MTTVNGQQPDRRVPDQQASDQQTSDRRASGRSFPPEGAIPRHIPPMLVGRIQNLDTASGSFQLEIRPLGIQPHRLIRPSSAALPDPLAASAAATNPAVVSPAVASPSADVSAAIRTRSYSKVHRIEMINLSDLRQGDSVLMRGQVDQNAAQVAALWIIRTEKPAHLSPGVSLAQAAPGAMTMEGGPETMADSGAAMQAPTPYLERSGTAASALPATNGRPPGGLAGPAGLARPAGVKPDQAVRQEELAKRQLEQAKRQVAQAAQRGVFRGVLTSITPLVVEVYDGELWTIQPGPRAIILDQAPLTLADLENGALVQVRGSETGPGLFRADEISLLPPGLRPAVLAALYRAARA
jgi:hypothetical protein